MIDMNTGRRENIEAAYMYHVKANDSLHTGMADAVLQMRV
jgi:hypothetical protein